MRGFFLAMLPASGNRKLTFRRLGNRLAHKKTHSGNYRKAFLITDFQQPERLETPKFVSMHKND